MKNETTKKNDLMQPYKTDKLLLQQASHNYTQYWPYEQTFNI